VLNHENLGTPNGTIASSFFGKVAVARWRILCAVDTRQPQYFFLVAGFNWI
jgi:hypothetical protein